MQSILKDILKNYQGILEVGEKGRSDDPELARRSSEMVSHFGQLKAVIMEILGKRYGSEDSFVKYGNPQGRWPEIGWIAFGSGRSSTILDKEFELPINIQFDPILKCCYLVILADAREWKYEGGRDWASKFQPYRDSAKSLILSLKKHGFSFDPPPINHLKKGSRGYSMRQVYVSWKSYELSAIPSDRDLIDDIDALLDAQERLSEGHIPGRRYWIITPSPIEGQSGSSLKYWDDWVTSGQVGLVNSKIMDNDGVWLLHIDYREDYDERYRALAGDRSQSDMVWNLIRGMKKGDIILAADGTREVVGKGMVGKKRQIDLKNDLPIRRDVAWERLSQPKAIPARLAFKVHRRLSELDEADYRAIMDDEVVHPPSIARSIEEKLLLMKGQIILYGPPGTGKTYSTRSLACSLIHDETRPKEGGE